LLRISYQNCKGPCEGLESKESYDEKIDAIRGIIKGDFRKARKYLEDEMFRFAANLEFEAAQNVKKD
jgi:excinuclease ABC subunit C